MLKARWECIAKGDRILRSFGSIDVGQGSRLLAQNGHGAMSELSPLSGEERKSNFEVVRSVDDPTETLGRCVLDPSAAMC